MFHEISQSIFFLVLFVYSDLFVIWKLQCIKWLQTWDILSRIIKKHNDVYNEVWIMNQNLHRESFLVCGMRRTFKQKKIITCVIHRNPILWRTIPLVVCIKYTQHRNVDILSSSLSINLFYFLCCWNRIEHILHITYFCFWHWKLFI